MSSALKPVLTAGGPQNAAVPPQMNKPIHPQNVNSPYGQPSTHMSQNLVNLPLNNPNTAHNNPAHTNTHLASTHQPNHYSLNVPNAPQHYMSNQPIPVSNHPVPNISQSQVGNQSQTFNMPQKNNVYVGNYQPNLGHPPNVLPPSQNVPVTQSQQIASSAESVQSNGTPEVRSPAKPVTETQQNHITVSKDKVPSPAPPPPPLQPPSNITSEKPKVSTPEKPSVPPQVTSDSKSIPEIKVTEVSSTSSVPNVISTNKSSSAEVTTTVATSVAPVAGESKDDKKGEPIPSASTPSSTIESTPTSQETTQIPEDKSHSSTSTSSENGSPTTNNQKTDQPSTQKTAQPKAATQRMPTKKSKIPKSDSPKNIKSEAKAGPTQKSPGSVSKSKRTRTRTQPYQSPLPELEIISKMTSTSSPKSRSSDDKLIIFYKNEFLAVRNSEGSFYVCQAVQNIYKSSPKIRIRWLSQDKNEKSGEIYTPDFYDNTDFDCILTNLNLERVDKGKFRLPPHEKERTDSILKRALAVEKGDATPPSLTEEHPDGLDLSLYKEESQLKKRRGKKRKASASLRSKTKVAPGKKSPEQAKVKKIEPKKAANKPVAKKAVVKKTAVKKLSTRKHGQVKKASVPLELKKSATAVSSSSGRAERAKRRSAENAGSAKTSPVVDQKKAKVIAKVTRKTVVAAPKTRPSRRKH